MADIEEIIRQIQEESRRKGGRAFASRDTYSDEPILIRGSQLASYRPEPIARMRDLVHAPEARGWSDARLFVEQGRLMEAYEDDCPYHGTFMIYFPTYQAMSDQQLRGYFTWRTRVRRGEVEETSASFAYVYLYELINGIGVEPGRPAFEAIRAFWEAYRDFEPAMDRYARVWLVDYAVYHDLDPELALPYANVAHDQAVGVLAQAEAEALADPAPRRRRGRGEPRDYAARDERDRRLLAALDDLSTYRVRASRLYHDDPDDLRRVCCAVFDRLARHYQGGRTQPLVTSLFGTRHPMHHLMFASAVFWAGGRHADCTYELGGIRTYACSGGIWTCDALHDGGGRSERLGHVLQATDRRLRDALGYPHPLKDRGEPKYLAQIIDREIGDYLAWKSTHAPRHVEIDLSKLDGIRSAAAETRESLLLDEEREEGGGTDGPDVGSDAMGAGPAGTGLRGGAGRPPGTGSPEGLPFEAPREDVPMAPRGDMGEDGPVPTGGPDAATSAGTGLGLSPDALALLQALLGCASPEATTPTPSADLLVDEINERLLDVVGDTVVEFGDDGAPALVEDYRDDVREALGA